jgi:hypothetical protein
MAHETVTAASGAFIAIHAIAGVVLGGGANNVADATFASEAVVELMSARLGGGVEGRSGGGSGGGNG